MSNRAPKSKKIKSGEAFKGIDRKIEFKKPAEKKLSVPKEKAPKKSKPVIQQIRTILLESESLKDGNVIEDRTRPLDGIAGQDFVISTQYRFKESRNTEYYEEKQPLNYVEFCDLGPQFIDQEGIMYRFADKRDALFYGLPYAGNTLARELDKPIGDTIVKGFKSLYGDPSSSFSSSSSSSFGPTSKGDVVKRIKPPPCKVILWIARPKGHTEIEFPPREPTETKFSVLRAPDKNKKTTGFRAAHENVVFYDIKTMLPLFEGVVYSDNVFLQPGAITGYVYVDSFQILN